MAKQLDRQTSFAGGEVDPLIRGRTDFAKYQSSCEVAKNFCVGPYGELFSRPGLVFAGRLYSGTTGRAVTFKVGDGGAELVLVLTSTGIRVFRSGAELAAAVSGTVPYAEADLPTLHVTQIGDVLILTHPDHYPRELYPTAADYLTWTIAPLTFAPYGYPDETGVPVITAWTDPPGANAVPWEWGITHIIEDDGVVYESALREVVCSGSRNVQQWAQKPPETTRIWAVGQFVHYAARPNNWYKCLVQHPRSYGAPHTLPTYWQELAWDDATVPAISLADTLTAYELDAEHPVTIEWPQYPVIAGGEFPAKVLATRVYRGLSGVWGLVGEVQGTNAFTDVGALPDWYAQPPGGKYLFAGYDTTPTGESAEHPSTCIHFEGRRIFAGFDARPTTVVASATERLANFERLTPAADDAPVGFDLRPPTRERIKALVATRKLLALTDDGEWEIGGVGGPLTPASVAAHKISRYGCGDLAPVTADQFVAWVGTDNVLPNMLELAQESGETSVHPVDVVALSRHLFVGHTVVGMAWARRPWRLLWLVRDDGTLVSCAVNLRQELVAWTPHETAGEVLSVTSAWDGTEDVLWAIVRRGAVVTIEYLATRVHDLDAIDMVRVDCAARHDGRNTTAVTVTCTAETDPALLAQGRGVRLQFSSDPTTAYTGKTIRVHWPDGTFVTASLLSVDVPGGGLYYANVDDYFPPAAEGVASAEWGVCVTSVSAPTAFAGQTLRALCDGAVVKAPTYDGAVAQVGVAAEVIIVGIQFDADFQSLPWAGEQARAKRKALVRAGLEVVASRGGWLGESLAADDAWRELGQLDGRPMQEVLTRFAEGNYSDHPLVTDTFLLPVDGSWGEHGRVAFRQEDPLPATIAAVVREVDVGG